MKGMDGMGSMAPAPPHGGHELPPQGKSSASASGHAAASMTTTQMSLFWGDRAVVLFAGWPGERGAGAYVLCLVFVAGLAALAEALAAVTRCVARRGAAAATDGRAAPASSAALLTAAHAARMALAYLVMLAVMSFNVGVLLAAVAGHALGFLLARSRVHTAAARGTGTGSAAAAADPDREQHGGVRHADGSKA